MMQALTNHGRRHRRVASVKEALAFIDQHLVNEGDLPENMGYFYQIETASRLHLDALNQLSSMPPPPDQPYKTRALHPAHYGLLPPGPSVSCANSNPVRGVFKSRPYAIAKVALVPVVMPPVVAHPWSH